MTFDRLSWRSHMRWRNTGCDGGMVGGVFRRVWLLNHPTLSLLLKQIMGGFIRWSGIWVRPLSSPSINLSTTQTKSSASSYTPLLWVTVLSHKTQWKSFVHITVKVILSSRERLVLLQTFLKQSVMVPCDQKTLCTVCYCRRGCMWTLKVNSSSWMWQTVPSMGTNVRTAS